MPVLLFVVATCLLIGAAQAQQPRQKGRCSGQVPDSLWLLRGPVYRDCEVDRKAELRGAEPRLDFTPSSLSTMEGRCFRAEFQFVVDTLGQPELATLRVQPGNDRALEQAVQPGIAGLRYVPARLADRPVRQLVLYKRAVGVIVRVVSSSGRPAQPVPPRPPVGC